MNINLIIQYAALILVLIGVVVYIVIRIIKMRKNVNENGNPCCGCAIKDNCSKVLGESSKNCSKDFDKSKK